MIHIEIIAGSPRQPSLNLRVAKYLHEQMQQHQDIRTGLIALNEVTFPFIQQVWKNADDAPEALRAVAERMFTADGFIVCTPEYNGGYSPAMKNLFDHFPKQNKKPLGIVTSSDGRMGGMRAAQQMLQLVPALFGIASPTLLIVPQAHLKFDENAALIDHSFEKNVHDFLSNYLWLVRKLVN